MVAAAGAILDAQFARFGKRVAEEQLEVFGSHALRVPGS
jgi:hypothetical protein